MELNIHMYIHKPTLNNKSKIQTQVQSESVPVEIKIL